MAMTSISTFSKIKTQMNMSLRISPFLKQSNDSSHSNGKMIILSFEAFFQKLQSSKPFFWKQTNECENVQIEWKMVEMCVRVYDIWSAGKISWSNKHCARIRQMTVQGLQIARTIYTPKWKAKRKKLCSKHVAFQYKLLAVIHTYSRLHDARDFRIDW